MSTEQIKSVMVAAANQDTPPNVTFPTSWVSPIIWLVARVGPMAAMAIVFCVYLGYDRNKIYDQNQALNSKILEAFTNRTVIETEHVSLLRSMQTTLAKIDDKLDRDKHSANP